MRAARSERILAGVFMVLSLTGVAMAASPVKPTAKWYSDGHTAQTPVLTSTTKTRVLGIIPVKDTTVVSAHKTTLGSTEYTTKSTRSVLGMKISLDRTTEPTQGTFVPNRKAPARVSWMRNRLAQGKATRVTTQLEKDPNAARQLEAQENLGR
jgi:hypothetical protein